MATHSTVHQWLCVHACLRTNIHDLILAYIWSWDAGSTNHSIHHSSIRCRQCIHATSPHLAHGKGNPTTLNANTHQSHNWENQDGWSLTICMVWCFLPTVPRNSTKHDVSPVWGFPPLLMWKNSRTILNLCPMQHITGRHTYVFLEVCAWQGPS